MLASSPRLLCWVYDLSGASAGVEKNAPLVLYSDYKERIPAKVLWLAIFERLLACFA